MWEERRTYSVMLLFMVEIHWARLINSHYLGSFQTWSEMLPASYVPGRREKEQIGTLTFM